MLPETPATEPRGKWHLLRWAIVVFALAVGWGGWRHYDFRQAVKEAEERGWTFEYRDPVELIGEDWKAAFRRETWNGSRRYLSIATGTVSESDLDLVRRLKPEQLSISATFPWRDLSQLKGLSNITELRLLGCPNLTNLDALKHMKKLNVLWIYGSDVLVNIDPVGELKNLTTLCLNVCTALENLDALRGLESLEGISLFGCTGLKNVDGLHGLTGLRGVLLNGCTGLTKEVVDALKTALPKAEVESNYE